MRTQLFLLFCILPYMVFSQKDETAWTEALRMQQLQYIEDSSTWDMPRMMKDNEPSPFGPRGFMTYGAYPVPDYDLIGEGSFKGVGNISPLFAPIALNGKKVVYSSFVVNDNPFYKSESGKDRAFFTLVTVTDTIDLEKYSTARFQIVSRNHPDYIGQGYVRTKNNQIDFMAFVTPEQNEYAVINMRLFNLQYGNVILIAPQKDGTLRSLQLDEQEVSSEGLDAFIREDLLERKEIVEFLTNEDVI